MVDTWNDFRRFDEVMNRMFEEFWGRPGRRRLLPSRLLPSGEEKGELVEQRQPFIDVVETDNEVIATAEMPGLEKEDINLNISEDRLEISAETKHEEKKEEKGYVYREISRGSYYRAISLPSSVDPDNSKATYNNGVLEVKMPKTEIKKKKPIKVE
ncbi:MAG: Hsp20/alpha crystallin family protein [Candidatus Methanoperedenaceae archaeon]|nr:Hsp20/alpha crystallin family protein [Candidatus Methanoperedenaceae archaeon]